MFVYSHLSRGEMMVGRSEQIGMNGNEWLMLVNTLVDQKLERGQEVGLDYKPQGLTPVTYFLQLGATSSQYHNFSKKCQ